MPIGRTLGIIRVFLVRRYIAIYTRYTPTCRLYLITSVGSGSGSDCEMPWGFRPQMCWRHTTYIKHLIFILLLCGYQVMSPIYGTASLHSRVCHLERTSLKKKSSGFNPEGVGNMPSNTKLSIPTDEYAELYERYTDRESCTPDPVSYVVMNERANKPIKDRRGVVPVPVLIGPLGFGHKIYARTSLVATYRCI